MTHLSLISYHTALACTFLTIGFDPLERMLMKNDASDVEIEILRPMACAVALRDAGGSGIGD